MSKNGRGMRPTAVVEIAAVVAEKPGALPAKVGRVAGGKPPAWVLVWV